MKSKRKLALAVIMALIVSMLPMTVFAESAQPEAGEYKADFKAKKTTEADDKYAPKISMTKFGSVNSEGDGKITVTVANDGKMTVHVNICSKIDTLKEVYVGDSKTGTKITPTVIFGDVGYFELDGTVSVSDTETIADRVKAGESFKIFTVTGSKNTEQVYDVKVINLAKKTDEEIAADEKAISDAKAAYEKAEAEKKAAEEAEEAKNPATLKVTILREEGMESADKGTPIKSEYRVKNGNNGGVIVVINGKTYSKYFMGKLAGVTAENAAVVNNPNTDGTIAIPFENPEVGVKIPVCIFTTMGGGKWIEYSFTFEEINEKKVTPDDVKLDENGATVTAEEDTKVILAKETVGGIMQEGAPLTIKSKTGTITFDGDAVSAAFANLDEEVTFEMKDVKESNPIFADSDYAMVLEISLTDAEGNNLFKEGGKGTAKITVPFTGEVPEGKTVKVFYITASGREEVEATYDKDAKTVTFTVSHFSQYGLEVADVTQAPNTGDNSLLFVFVGLMLMSGVAFVATKKGLIK